MVSRERSVLPLLATQTFALTAFTASATFIVAFGMMVAGLSVWSGLVVARRMVETAGSAAGVAGTRRQDVARTHRGWARDAIEAHLGGSRTRRRLLAAGSGRSGHSDISERIEEILAAEVPASH